MYRTYLTFYPSHSHLQSHSLSISTELVERWWPQYFFKWRQESLPSHHRWFFWASSVQTWSNLYIKVIFPGRLTLRISCENFLDLLSNEWLTQFYHANQHVNWINKNFKFICSPFEVCIKISKSSQAWTTGLEEICMCFQHINPIYLNLFKLPWMTLLHAIKVQAGVVKMCAWLFH